MTSIAADGIASIHKQVTIVPSYCPPEAVPDEDTLLAIFEINKSVEWIKNNEFKRICLQFPDELLYFSPKVSKCLEKLTGCRTYILADSTYGSCCVDEKTAQHVPNADALIHYGPSCLSHCSERVPVQYIFTRPPIAKDKVVEIFRSNYNASDPVVILFDVIYEYLAEQLYNDIIHNGFTSVMNSTLILPSSNPKLPSDSENSITKCNRKFSLPSNCESIDSCNFFYIGSRTLPNLLLSMPRSVFKVFDPVLSSEAVITSQISAVNKLIRKRNYYVEKIKDSKSVGILVGTLVIQRYLDLIERLKTILRASGKKYYVVAIGEINPCKLANFMDIECFVFVGCPEVVNYYLSDECKGQFFQPILTPYDVELAFCNQSDESFLGENYVIDWTLLMDKGPPCVKPCTDDVSLITGDFRATVTLGEQGYLKSPVVNWQGLKIDEESPSENSEVHQGRSGIAAHYIDEPKVSS